ncbi:protein METABOLIC NETWORK MODULATOR 1-like [Andrographis paniculata]|uniref:protein METABOLIC NETWORK MODULATOR 1-like n=1 Tax=Andrographis paniculata TaxID=175694 RepID=UPI0021E7FEAC|nr:protein METABOLIC NETWORK MODULATOR 1-like [Andrographis paniculata]
MDSVNQGENSENLSIVPAKRRRGRPPKDPSLKHAEAANLFHGSAAKQNNPPPPERSAGSESAIGQIVTGVIDGTFDAGYLLSVRIGDSNTRLRGMVFKPGGCVPITPENDIAPHLPMIRRQDIPLPPVNQGQSHGQKLGEQTPATTPSKRKYTPRRIANGNLTPAVHQPANNIPSESLSSDPGDEDVHMVEPLSMLPPDQSIPAGQIFASAQGHSNHEVAAETEKEDVSMNDATSEERSKLMTPADIDSTPGSSQMSDSKTEDAKADTAKSSPEDSGMVMKPLFSYGTGRMTELLQAVQENMKDAQVQFSEQPSFASGVGFPESSKMEFDQKNGVSHDGKP